MKRVSIPARVAVDSAVPFALKCVEAQGPDCWAVRTPLQMLLHQQTAFAARDEEPQPCSGEKWCCNVQHKSVFSVAAGLTFQNRPQFGSRAWTAIESVTQQLLAGHSCVSPPPARPSSAAVRVAPLNWAFVDGRHHSGLKGGWDLQHDPLLILQTCSRKEICHVLVVLCGYTGVSKSAPFVDRVCIHFDCMTHQ